MPTRRSIPDSRSRSTACIYGTPVRRDGRRRRLHDHRGRVAGDRHRQRRRAGRQPGGRSCRRPPEGGPARSTARSPADPRTSSAPSHGSSPAADPTDRIQASAAGHSRQRARLRRFAGDERRRPGGSATHRHRQPRRAGDAPDPRRARAAPRHRRRPARDRPAHRRRAGGDVRPRGRRGGLPRRRGRPPAPGSPYLDLATLERALLDARADAAWVGWGFVAERPEFAELCDRLGIVFVGPRADVMRTLGDKIGAKLLAEQADVRWRAWSGGPVETVDDAVDHAERHRLPADGQGGRRRRRPRHPPGRRRRPARRGVRERQVGGRQGVRRPDRVHRARGHRRPPRRGPVDRRPPRHRLGRRASATAACSGATRR